MRYRLKGKGLQAANFDTHKEFIKAALRAKSDCDELADLLVDELRKEHPGQTVVLLQAVIRAGRSMDALCQWAKTALLVEPRIPREKLRELEAAQLALAAYLANRRRVT